MPTFLLARQEGFEVLQRPEDLATSTSATDPVLRHAVRTLNIENLAAVVMLYGNIPLRRGGMIDRAIQMLFETGADSVQPLRRLANFILIGCSTFPATKKSASMLRTMCFGVRICRRFIRPPARCYVMRTSVLMAGENSSDPHAFLGVDRRGLITAAEDSVDIDTEKDFISPKRCFVPRLNESPDRGRPK